jgi:hypothetical protein
MRQELRILGSFANATPENVSRTVTSFPTHCRCKARPQSRASLSACSHKQLEPARRQGAGGAPSRYQNTPAARQSSITCCCTASSSRALWRTCQAFSLEQGSCARRACWPCVPPTASRSPPLLHPPPRAIQCPRRPPCAQDPHWHVAASRSVTIAQYGAE